MPITKIYNNNKNSTAARYQAGTSAANRVGAAPCYRCGNTLSPAITEGLG